MWTWFPRARYPVHARSRVRAIAFRVFYVGQRFGGRIADAIFGGLVWRGRGACDCAEGRMSGRRIRACIDRDLRGMTEDMLTRLHKCADIDGCASGATGRSVVGKLVLPIPMDLRS